MVMFFHSFGCPGRDVADGILVSLEGLEVVDVLVLGDEMSQQWSSATELTMPYFRNVNVLITSVWMLEVVNG